MPNHDGTGPQGNGKPGRGNSPCHSELNHNQERQHFHNHRHHNFRGCGRQQSEGKSAAVYDYTTDELNARKQALQKELHWLEARITELGEKHEDSNPGN